MPKFFKNNAEYLHCQAYASLLLISARLAANPNEFRLYEMQEKAQARVYRRWQACNA